MALGLGPAFLLGEGGEEVTTCLSASRPPPNPALPYLLQPRPVSTGWELLGQAWLTRGSPLAPQWSCCGARGPNDWNLNIYFNCTDLNPSRERCGVPFSCCVRDPAVSGAW